LKPAEILVYVIKLLPFKEISHGQSTSCKN
jgi:hypothetical protein